VVGVAAIARIAAVLVLAPDNRCCCSIVVVRVAETGRGICHMVVMKGRRIV
jgi:hypothetical protein